MRAISTALVTATLFGCFGCAAESIDPADEPDDVADDGKLDSPNSADNPRVPQGAPTRYPIILVHGFAGSPMQNGFESEVWTALCKDGHSVYVPTLPPFASAETRAETLGQWITWIKQGATDWCGNKPAVLPTKVNIIAHSMGGLDSRVAASSGGHGPDIAALVTLATPHRGSFIADAVLGLGGTADKAALDGLAQYAGRAIDPNAPDLKGAFLSLSEAHSGEFEQRNPPSPTTYYESWGGLSNVAGIPNAQDWPACENKMSLFPAGGGRHRMSVVLKPIAAVVAHGVQLIPNDGLVTVASAKYGNFRGCMPSDHADEVGAFPMPRFDYLRFIRNRAFDLAARGF
jgi:triacylglycerol lipase